MFFDGNPRSNTRRGGGGKRPVNLGGKSVTVSRTRLLQQSQQLRQERWHKQRQHTQATVVQKYLRGFLTRRRLVHVLRQEWNNPTNPVSSSLNLPTLSSKTTVLQRFHVLVRLLLLQNNNHNCKTVETQITSLLMQFAQTLPPSPPQIDNKTTVVYSKYIWHQTLHRLQSMTDGRSTNDNSWTWRVLQHCLPQHNPCHWLSTHDILLLCQTCLALPPHDNSNRPNGWSLQDYLVQSLLRPHPAARPVLGVLEWLRMEPNNSNDNDNHYQTSSTQQVETLQALVQALLSSSSSSSIPSNNNKNDNKTSHIDWSSIARTLVLEPPPYSCTANRTTPPQLLLLHLLDRVLDVESSSPLLSSRWIVPLIWMVWQSLPSLIHATTLVASSLPSKQRTRQEEEALIFGHVTTRASMDLEDNNDDPEEEDDDDDEEEPDTTTRTNTLRVSAPAAIPTGTLRTGSARFFTKQDLATAPKLERLVQQTQTVWTRQQGQQLETGSMAHPQHLRSCMTRVAHRLAQPQVWLHWGHQLLRQASSSKEEKDDTTTTTTSQDAREAYILCLTVLLQGQRTGLHNRSSASSHFLTQLAFAATTTTNQPPQQHDHDILTWLWHTILYFQQQAHHQRQEKSRPLRLEATRLVSHPTESPTASRRRPPSLLLLYCTWSVFCDILAQQLIAVRDDQFLERYTTTLLSSSSSWRRTTTTANSPRIVARDVIEQLKQHLYDLYWSQPVVTSETQALLVPSTTTRALLVTTTTTNNHTMASTRIQQQPQPLLLSAARVRLFLAGTKLWNSLYARWCRLVRLKGCRFCEESTWWFPNHNSMLGGLAASASAVSADSAMGQAAQDDDEDDDMDDDDDDDDNDMDVDDGNQPSRNNRSSSSRTHSNHPNETEDAETEALANVFKDPKMARVLVSIPQCLSFERRVRLFHSLLQEDKARTQDESYDMHATVMALMRGEDTGVPDETAHRVNVEIRRDALYQDSMRQLNQLGPHLKKKVKVSFISQHGTQEAGIDGGGVFKEFLDDLIKEAFTPPPSAGSESASASSSSSHQLQLFAVTPSLETLMVNPLYSSDPQYLPHYEFLGRAVGKAVYESLLVEPQFCLPFLNTLLGKSNTLEDLKNFDPTYYHSLVQLIRMSRQDLETTGLTFEVNLPGQRVPVELVPHGAQKPVTKDNVIQYAHLVSHRLLNVQSARPIRAFLQGFRDLIPAPWVRLFSSAHELQKLISGNDDDDDETSAGFNVQALKANMAYSGGYHPSQPVMHMFWEIVEEMTSEQHRKFLKFMTSCSRQPLLGFGSLDPRPCIQQVRLPENMFVDTYSEIRTRAMSEVEKQAPLPTASTCMNLLKLPNYPDKELMRRKLLAAIEAGAGFELS